MAREIERGASQRERLELIAAALIPGALALLHVTVERAGRLGWLCPVLALPVGLWLCRLWRKVDELGETLDGAFGKLPGGLLRGGYLLWGLFLLAVSARQYAHRLLMAFGGNGSVWFFLGAGLLLVFYLTRREEVLARSGRIFLLALVAVTGMALLLALPSVRWENLWPAEASEAAGLPVGAAGVLSLAGYAVYALCLPRRGADRVKPGWWAVWSCGGMALLLAVTVGAFGVGLTLRMDEPFLYILKGVGLPGAFRRGEAALATVVALGDLTLMGLLARGCISLGESFTPGRKWWTVAGVGVSFLLAGLIPGREETLFLIERVAPAGNLIGGVVIPAVAILTKGWRRRGEGETISCGGKSEKMENMGAEKTGKKRPPKNEKRC